MSTCLIISGGEYSPIDLNISYDYVIACDAGYDNSIRLGIKPNLVIGDFDSYEGSESDIPSDISVKKYPVKKDDTDTMLAIKHAMELGYKHIVLCCALGRRMDHTMANLQSMAYVAANGGFCQLLSEDEHMMTFTGPKVELPRCPGYSLSLFSLSDVCTGLCISGAEYDVSDIVLTNSFPLGLGNSWKEDTVTLEMKEGILLIIKSKFN